MAGRACDTGRAERLAALTGLAAVAAVGNAPSFTTVSVGAGLLAGLATARPVEPAPCPASSRSKRTALRSTDDRPAA